jgi:opacity protein-like surface antigen
MNMPYRPWHLSRITAFAALAASVASPALAREPGPYVSIQAGVALAKGLHGDALVDAVGINSVCLPGKSLCEEVPEHFSRPNVFRTRSKPGADIDATVGWNLGPISLEAELGWKRLKRDGFTVGQDFLDYSSAILRRPLDPQALGAPGAPALVADDFDMQMNNVNVKSVMANVIADVFVVKQTSVYAGAGVGSAWAEAVHDRDNTWAAQAIAGFETRVAPRVHLGLRYRYFRTGGLYFVGDPREFVGNPYIAFAGGLQFNQQDSATITPHLHGRVSSHSLLATLTFSLR